MLFSKTSKKTNKQVEETAGAPEGGAPAESSTPRSTRSSKSKSSEASETGSVKHRKAATKVTPTVSEATVSDTPKAFAAAASATQAPAVKEVVAAPAPVSERKVALATKPEVTQEQIEALAYSYYVARNYGLGSPEQDWLRAERELNASR